MTTINNKLFGAHVSGALSHNFIAVFQTKLPSLLLSV